MKDDIRAQIRRIKIFTKRLVSTSLSGDYLSAFKGSGMEFDQIREYQVGDDIRFIDWNSSAKANKLMVKQFIEERDRTIILMIDISSSGEYASDIELKKELVAKVASSIALISSENSDKVGAIFFTDKVEKWMPPKKGIPHINNILETILSIQPQSKKTDIAESLRFLVSQRKHNWVVFMLSDFIDTEENYSKFLKVASCKHDFIGIRITDSFEQEIPDVGFIEVNDPETGEQIILDTKNLSGFLKKRFEGLRKTFDKYKIDLLDLNTNKPFAIELMKFFRKRIRRSI